jgi:hypothetical protein
MLGIRYTKKSKSESSQLPKQTKVSNDNVQLTVEKDFFCLITRTAWRLTVWTSMMMMLVDVDLVNLFSKM